MKIFQHKIIVSLFIGLLFLTGCNLQQQLPIEEGEDIDLGGRTAGSWKKVSNQLKTNNDIPVRIDNDLLFYDEIKPDGALCSDGEILKKTGADNWDCASDDGGAGSTTFAGLTDTPANYTGSGSKVVAVNAGEDALEFISAGAGDMTKAVYDTNDNSVVDTATALASNGANCSAGNSPLGVDASGAVESCFDVWTEAENTSAGYISGNESISLSGDISGTGATAITTTIGADKVHDTMIDWGTGANQVNSDDIPDHNGHSIRDTFTHITNRGKATSTTISLDGGLDISWGAGENYDGASNTFFTTDAGNDTLTNNSTNYLKWISGTTLSTSTSSTADDEILIATFSVYDGNINGYRETSSMDETIANTRRGLRALFPNRIISGMSVSEDTDITNDLDLKMDAGVIWKDAIEKKTPIEILTRNTPLIKNFHTGGVWDSATSTEIETTNYDNGTQLTAITAGKYVKGLFIFMNGSIGFIYPVEFFNTIAQAQEASLPAMPTGLELVSKLTAIIYQQGDTDFSTAIWQDIRAGISEESFIGVTDHGQLAGLSDDDHPQYGALAQNETITGEWNFSATTTFGDDIEMLDDKKFYFDTAKSKYLEYNTDHGELFLNTDTLAVPGALWIYANTGADGNGNWEPFIEIQNGAIHYQNITQGNAGQKYFQVYMTDGFRIRTTQTQSAILLADNLSTSNKTFQFPNSSGTFIIGEGVAGGQTLIGGTATTDDLTLQTTSGVGATGADMHFLVGNDGGTEAMTILNNGYVGIGTITPAYTLSLGTGKSFGLGTTQWNSGDSIDADAIVNGSTNAIPTLTQETNWDTAFGWGDHIDWTADQGATNIHAGNYTTLTDLTDFDQTAWRLFYSNNLGDVIELSLGTDGQYLKSQGGTSSLTWGIPTDTNTTYSASGTLLDETSEVFSVNEGTLTDTKYCIYTTGVGIVCNSEGGSGVALSDNPTWTGEHTFAATTTMATTTMTALTVSGTGTSTVFVGNVQIDGNLDVAGDVGGAGMIALITTMIAAALVTFASAVVTLTNKRVTMRVTTEASSATPTINTNNSDMHSITALATAITSMTTNFSGTETNGQKLIIRILDNGTARAITWGASFEDNGVALPTTTTVSKLLTVGFIYDTVSSKWGCVAVADET